MRKTFRLIFATILLHPIAVIGFLGTNELIELISTWVFYARYS